MKILVPIFIGLLTTLIAILCIVLLIAVAICAYWIFSYMDRPCQIKKPKDGKVIWFIRRALEVKSKNGKESPVASEVSETRKINFLRYIFLKFFKKGYDDSLLWMALNDIDSTVIEQGWLNRQDTINQDINVMNGLFKVNMDYTKLTPNHWKQEKANWFLMRGEYIYEVPFSPPIMYFINIKPDPQMAFYYQPMLKPKVSSSDEEKDILLYDVKEFRSEEKNNDPLYIIFVIHGIGHHKSEKGNVENANHVREGFVKYLKKFHPTFQMPVIIPISWRCNLPMDDERIRTSQSLKFELAGNLGTTLNDLFYYTGKSKNKLKISLINELNSKYKFYESAKPKVSLLAHSLGSVIAFDILNEQRKEKSLNFDVENMFLIGSPLARFLIYMEYDVEDLKQNPWIKDGRILNIINPDDPVVHRLETLFNSFYQYLEPLALSLADSTETTSVLSANDQQQFLEFHTKLTDERALAAAHDSLIQIDYCKKGQQQSKNPSEIPDEQFQFNLPEALKMKFSKTNVVDVKHLDILEQFSHRFDYNLFHNESLPKFIDFETYSFVWAKRFALSHSSYWKSQEMIALMTNIIYDYGSGPDRENHIPFTTTVVNGNKRRKVLALFLAMCRLFCTVSLINHTVPIFPTFVSTKLTENQRCIESELKDFRLNVTLQRICFLFILAIPILRNYFIFLYRYFFNVKCWCGVVLVWSGGCIYILFTLQGK